MICAVGLGFVVSCLAGAALTCLPGRSPGPPALPGFSPWAALLAGAVSAAALGVDFPGSSRRFSRLA